MKQNRDEGLRILRYVVHRGLTQTLYTRLSAKPPQEAAGNSDMKHKYHADSDIGSDEGVLAKSHTPLEDVHSTFPTCIVSDHSG